MKLILYLSNYMIPLIIFYTIGFGLLSRRPMYDDFVEGAKEGARTAAGTMPTLIGLMVAVGVLRASGFLDALAAFFGQWTDHIGFPAELMPVTLVRIFSSGTVAGLALDIFKRFGTDSYYGLITSIMLSRTEAILYTMSVYFMTVRVKKTRYTLAGALITTLSGVIVGVTLTGTMTGKWVFIRGCGLFIKT